MAEENKAPGGQETPVKTTDEVLAELKVSNETLNKRLKDQEEMIGRQSTEIGELRKKAEPKPEPQDKDDLVEELTHKLMVEEKLDEETARYNAKILAKSGNLVIDKKLNDRMLNEVVDLVQEAMDEKKMDEAVYKENETEIMSEFKARKLAPTARRNYKILRDCYDIVVRRKADALRIDREKKDGSNRDELIDEVSQPPSGAKGAPKEENVTEAIKNSGPKKNEVFF